ncbi:MAG: large-conductance mechanosensitive channel-like protein [candidate division WWE3 bacterium GW2011_GWA1_41_8]|uniref:Large-conductance mechanosensitive channel-like protein n=2 Tax=Katanobacteria TaxID=422282 RepID=A0A0G0XD60_UNCKA|nr:MAG: large-conductance mechanosensitive channel-like protein [candidate division WWE3 bacterium GW2011_GWB1_41_6]KKS22805.1 MAG: large-conductance mechanosensitive channel-like protein [candidate division WWE3 bacterium GW2011_GWA1_41_8]
MKGFLTFIREQGIIGLAMGFVLGGSVSKLVTSFVNDIINPIIGIGLGKVGQLNSLVIPLGPARIMIGNFISVLIDFLIIAGTVYFIFKQLKLDRLDKKKD